MIVAASFSAVAGCSGFGSRPIDSARFEPLASKPRLQLALRRHHRKVLPARCAHLSSGSFVAVTCFRDTSDISSSSGFTCAWSGAALRHTQGRGVHWTSMRGDRFAIPTGGVVSDVTVAHWGAAWDAAASRSLP